MSLLQKIRTPLDLKNLAIDQLPVLAHECRQKILDAVSQNGGHLASNLGVVELTLALHYVYDFGPFPAGPDRLLWDVGHQSYVHKLLTGRQEGFSKLRRKNSVCGFPNPVESPYDLFAVGHAGSAISAANGIARADALSGKKNNVVAIVGDASIVNGLAFEGLNHAAGLKRQLLIILNDNGMSISKTQGSFAALMERVRVSTTYHEAKEVARKWIESVPGGKRLEMMLYHFKEAFKSGVWPGQIFEALNLKYFGVIDGHDIPELVQVLSELKGFDQPAILHVRTVKGKGHPQSASEPTKFHSPSSFTVNGAKVEFNPKPGKPWTKAFSDILLEMASNDPKVVALTAGMPDGTGLDEFERRFPDRFIDTGISESHQAALAAGMAKGGMHPVVAVYSTFFQRSFDQFWQEIALNQLPVIFCLDRAGLVGEDGAVHHGFMDIAMTRPIPGVTLIAPADEFGLQSALHLARQLDGPAVIRYPRDVVPKTTISPEPWILGKGAIIREGADAIILSYGALLENALVAADQLAQKGLSVGVYDMRFCKPLDLDLLQHACDSAPHLFTLEDHSIQGGFGSAAVESAMGKPITRLGLPDRFIAHASRSQQLAETQLDVAGIALQIKEAIKSRATEQIHNPSL